MSKEFLYGSEKPSDLPKLTQAKEQSLSQAGFLAPISDSAPLPWVRLQRSSYRVALSWVGGTAGPLDKVKYCQEGPPSRAASVSLHPALGSSQAGCEHLGSDGIGKTRRFLPWIFQNSNVDFLLIMAA